MQFSLIIGVLTLVFAGTFWSCNPRDTGEKAAPSPRSFIPPHHLSSDLGRRLHSPGTPGVEPFKGTQFSYSGGTAAYRATVEQDLFRVATPQGASASFRTQSLGREGARVSSSTWTKLDTDGAVKIGRGACVESLRTTSAGVSQSWRLPELPDGKGDFVVRVEALGQSFLTETDGGLHFMDKATAALTRYGHAMWIEADGDETPIPARFLNGAIELRVASTLVEESAYPVVLDPIVGPETRLDEGVGGDPAPSRLVPWPPNDAGTMLLTYAAEGNTFALMINSSGELLDTSPIRLTSSPDTQGILDVSSDGEGFLLLEMRMVGSESHLYGIRVGADGSVLDPGGFPISTTPEQKFVVRVIWAGTHHLVIWTHRTGVTPQMDVFGVRIAPDGTLLDAEPFSIASGPNEELFPDMAFDGINSLVVWASRNGDEDDLYGARVSPSGVVLDPGGFLIAQVANQTPRQVVSFNGTHYLVVWEDGDLYAKRVEPDTTLLDPVATVIAQDVSYIEDPHVVADGDLFHVAWTAESPTSQVAKYKSRISADGEVLDEATVLPTQGTEELSFVAGSRPWLFLSSSSSIRLWGATVEQDGTLTSPGLRPIVAPPPASSTPALASNGAEFFAVWRDSRRAPVVSTLFGLPLSANGAPLEDVAVPIAAYADELASIASNGDDYFVVWSDISSLDDDVLGRRISRDGAFLDENPIVISAGDGEQHRPSVAYDGSNYFVVWQDDRNEEGEGDLYGARVTPDGEVLDESGIAIFSGPEEQSYPNVASNGEGLVVTWQETVAPFEQSIHALRTDSSGAALGAELVLSELGNYEARPQVSSDGQGFLVVWRENRDYSEIRGARISATGTLLDADAIDISSAPGIQRNPTVGFDGTSYVVAWSDDRNGFFDLRGARVQVDGTVGESNGFEITDTNYHDDFPALAFNAGGSGIVTFASEREIPGVFAQTVLANCTLTGEDESLCNGVDDDCDGQTDEDYVLQPTECGAGPCVGTGELTCLGGVETDTCAPPSDAPLECFPVVGSGGAPNSSTGGAPSGEGAFGGSPIENPGDPGTGGTNSGDSSSDPEANDSSSTRQNRKSGGCDCGCRVAHDPVRPMSPWACGALVLAVVLRRRLRQAA